MFTLGLGRAGAIGIFVCAAILEVGGDALIRRGLRGGGAILVALGFLTLGSYGVVVNLLDVDFSRLLGAYVGVFAVASIAFGHLVFGDQVPPSTWIGLAIILAGSLVVHLGRV
jgi:small multidrug resistance family-3 protein